MFVLLSADGLQRYPLLAIERKRCPEPVESGHERHWGFVDIVTEDPESIEYRLARQFFYETTNRGERYLAAVHPIGEGVYRIGRHDGHTPFAYALQLPKRISEAQEAFNVTEQTIIVISIKTEQAAGTVFPDDCNKYFAAGTSAGRAARLG